MSDSPAPPQSSHLGHPKYRRDIDGLRAIAVLSVVGYHAFPDWVRGGFVGVDVFFVISGFLISTIIFSNLDQGVFSFREFYARRIRRIFPALILVLIACYTLGWFALLADEYEQLGKHIAGGAGFISNFVLWQESGYFDTGSELKPLLHLWSLGIEEQFYIVWPLLLYLAWKTRLNLALLTLIIVILSFLLNLNNVYKNAAATFYSPGTRFWELLLGGTLAYIVLFKKKFPENLRRRRDALLGRIIYILPPLGGWEIQRNSEAFLGFLLITLAAFGLSKERSFPGWWAILPTVGALFSIAAGPDAWLNRKVLSNRMLVFIGLISFPLYLWHWPLLAFVRIVGSGTPACRTRVAAVIISIVLAWLTYELLEKPIRFGKYGKEKITILCSLMLGIASTGVLTWKGFISPYSTTFGLGKIIKAAGEWEYPGPNFKPFEFQGRWFLLRQSNENMKTLYFGDSNIEQYGPRIDKLIIDNIDKTKSAVFATGAGCPPIPQVQDKDNPDCIAFVEKTMAYARSPDVDTIVVGAQWLGYLVDSNFYYEDDGVSEKLGLYSAGAEHAYKALEIMLSQFSKSGKKVYLILNIPIGPGIDPKDMVQRSLLPFGFNIKKTGIQKSDFLGMYNPIRQRLINAGTNGGAKIIDPLDYLCTKNLCPSLTEDGEPIYKDACHIRPLFSRERVKFLDETIMVY